jgi:hypothetical protein
MAVAISGGAWPRSRSSRTRRPGRPGGWMSPQVTRGARGRKAPRALDRDYRDLVGPTFGVYLQVPIR